MDKNEGNNNLHSGFIGYHNFIYEVDEFLQNDSAVTFTRLSPDMEQGFPGNLKIRVTYSLTDDNEVIIQYYGVSDKDTIVNLTNHYYFNLSGHGSGDILEHKLMLLASRFTPTDEKLIPTGEIRDVEGTPMDFRVPKIIGQDINMDYSPLKIAGGYDHNYILDGYCGLSIRKVVELVDENSGRALEVFTNEPCMQLYTGNSIPGTEIGKDNVVYKKYAGLCFETQKYPNSCNIPEFPGCILKAGDEYKYETRYRFSVR